MAGDVPAPCLLPRPAVLPQYGQITILTGRPDSSVVFATDDAALFRYPFAYLTEVGCWEPTAAELQTLRADRVQLARVLQAIWCDPGDRRTLSTGAARRRPCLG